MGLYDINQQTTELLNSFKQNMMPVQNTEKHVTKVNGRAGAEAFAMPPNSDDILLDMNAPLIWFVQTDGAGYKTITPYDINPHKEIKQEDVLKSIEDRLSKLEEEVRNVKFDATGKSDTSANGSRSKSGN